VANVEAELTFTTENINFSLAEGDVGE